MRALLGILFYAPFVHTFGTSWRFNCKSPRVVHVSCGGQQTPRPVDELSIRDMQLELQRRGIDHRDLLERNELEERIATSRSDCRPLGLAVVTTMPQAMGLCETANATTAEAQACATESKDYYMQASDLLRQSQPQRGIPTAAPSFLMASELIPCYESATRLPIIPAGGYKEVLQWARDPKLLSDEDLALLIVTRGLGDEAALLFAGDRRQEVAYANNMVESCRDLALLIKSLTSLHERVQFRQSIASLLAGDVVAERSFVGKHNQARTAGELSAPPPPPPPRRRRRPPTMLSSAGQERCADMTKSQIL